MSVNEEFLRDTLERLADYGYDQGMLGLPVDELYYKRTIKAILQHFQQEQENKSLKRAVEWSAGQSMTEEESKVFAKSKVDRLIREAEQKPVGDAIEIKVPKETMQAVMARINLKPKTIANRVIEPQWRVEAWIDGSADEYDLEVVLWKLRILAGLTGGFNWYAFLLESDNLDILKKKTGRLSKQEPKEEESV